MNADKIVRALKEMLPPQVDYAELVGSPVPSSYGVCYVWEDPEPYHISAAIDLIESLQAQLSASQQETRAAVDKAILWGADLISCNTDAHATFCAECGFPIADYGVDREVFCRMCESKNASHNYVTRNYATVGPGSCRTTQERKAKIYDKLFRHESGPQEAEKGENNA